MHSQAFNNCCLFAKIVSAGSRGAREKALDARLDKLKIERAELGLRRLPAELVSLAIVRWLGRFLEKAIRPGR